MAENPKKRIHVGRFDYAIDEDVPALIAKINAAIEAPSGGLVEIKVLDDNDRQLVLYLNVNMVDAFAIDSGLGPPRPTEISGAPGT